MNQKDVSKKNVNTSVTTNRVKVKAVSNRDVRGMRAARNINIDTIRKKEKTPFPTAIVFTAMMITVLVLYTMINHAEISSVEKEIAGMRSEITALQKEEAKLRNQLTMRYEKADIERIAIEELDMVPSSELEREYVDLTNDDKTEIVKYEDEETGIGMLSSFGELLKSLFKE